MSAQNLGYIFLRIKECGDDSMLFGLRGCGTLEVYIQMMQSEYNIEIKKGSPYGSGSIPLLGFNDEIVAVWVPMSVAPEIVLHELFEETNVQVRLISFLEDAIEDVCDGTDSVVAGYDDDLDL